MCQYSAHTRFTLGSHLVYNWLTLDLHSVFFLSVVIEEDPDEVLDDRLIPQLKVYFQYVKKFILHLCYLLILVYFTEVLSIVKKRTLKVRKKTSPVIICLSLY